SGIKMPLEIVPVNNVHHRKQYWKKLLDNKLITQSKYFKLMKECFSDQDKESFFARQLVETRQITKNVRDLLHTRFENTEIHRSEEHTSELQSRFDIVCRLLLEKKKQKI